MQFQVPQFIDTEDKIIGPLTLKQFAYLAGGGFVLFVLYFILEFWLWLAVGLIIGLFILALAFLKYNGRSFLVLVFAMLNYFWRPRFYIWRGENQELRIKNKEKSSLSILGFKLNTFTNPLSERREKPLHPSILDRFRGAKEKFEVFRKVTGERDAARRVDYR